MKQKKINRMIDECLTDFAFGQVQKIMSITGWKWGSENGDEAHVPDVQELMVQSLKLLRDVAEHIDDGSRYALQTGGLQAETVDGVLSLKFVVAEAESYGEDA